MQRNHPSVRRLMHSEHPASWNGKAGFFEICFRILSAEGKRVRLQQINTVVCKQRTRCEPARERHHMQAFPAMAGKRLKPSFRLRQAGRFKAIQHDIRFLCAFKVFKRLRNGGNRILVRDADGEKLLRTVRIHLRNQLTDRIP